MMVAQISQHTLSRPRTSLSTLQLEAHLMLRVILQAVTIAFIPFLRKKEPREIY